MTCRCVDVEVGSYDNQVELTPPSWSTRTDGRGICVDRCLQHEIALLWHAGIQTTGCCCGHNVAPAYIGVTEQCIEPMLAMGYTILENTVRPGARDSFAPKSLA